MPKMVKVTVQAVPESSDYEHLPDDWDEMTDVDQAAYLESCADDFRSVRVGCHAEVVELEEE